MASLPLIVFWTSIFWLMFAFFGFPLLLILRAWLAPAGDPATTPDDAPEEAWPRLSYVIVVHNEQQVIDEKLRNCDTLRYPLERLEIIVASDGSDDGTNERVLAWQGKKPVRLIALPRLGKNAALNAAVAEATGEVFAFSDADSMLDPDALLRLVAPFADPSIGGVGGDYRYGALADEGSGERAYWNMDRYWKHLESRCGSMTSATGQLYALRRDCFEAVPDGVTDDFHASTGAVAAGLRLLFAEDARASGPVADTERAEFRRKTRLMTRGLVSVWSRRRLLDPRATGFYALQLLTHKLLRRLCGVPVLAIALATPFLWNVSGFYRLALLAQLGLHGMALAAVLGRGTWPTRTRLFTLPLFFDLVNLAGLIALFGALRGKRHLGWVPYRPAHSSQVTENRPAPAADDSA